MELKQQKIEILSLLFENLNNPKPELLPTSMIERQIDISTKVLQQTLKSMEGMGLIQTDPDFQYNLITREGVSWLKLQRGVVA